MDKLLMGLGVTVVGLTVVFAGLLILVVLIKLMQGAFSKAEKPAAPAAPKAAPAPAPAPAAAPVVEEEPDLSDDSEIVAAIMAALSCVYEGTGKRPVVRAVRRSSRDWKHAYR